MDRYEYDKILLGMSSNCSNLFLLLQKPFRVEFRTLERSTAVIERNDRVGD